MNKFLLSVILTFLVCIISINAQQPERPFPTKLDDFSIYTFKEEGITTELIECNPTSDGYAKASIYRNYGIPRFGVIINCNQNIDTILYIPDTFKRSTSGGINSPLFTDTAITIWWKEDNFNVKIMDVLTGNIVLDKTHQGQSAGSFVPAPTFPTSNEAGCSTANSTTPEGKTSIKDSIPGTPAVVSYEGPITNISFPEGTSFKKDNNSGTTISYSNLPAGLYWIYITDDKSIIWYMKTIRKGV